MYLQVVERNTGELYRTRVHSRIRKSDFVGDKIMIDTRRNQAEIDLFCAHVTFSIVSRSSFKP